MTAESHARYLANPRQCIACGGKPSAGRPRCGTCHQEYVRGQNEGRVQ